MIRLQKTSVCDTAGNGKVLFAELSRGGGGAAVEAARKRGRGKGGGDDHQ